MDTISHYIEGKGRHSIMVLLALHAISLGGRAASWKDVKEWFKERGENISDGTFRARRLELERIGLVERQSIDPLKFSAKLTPKGVKAAQLITELTDKLKALESSETQK